MPARLPPEILRQILRDATLVPDALDTSTEHILHEHRGALYAALAASLATKRALSLASRQLHALADEFLHDVLLLRSYAHIAPLLARLRTAPAPGAPARGWWVRRIDLDLGADGYAGDGWHAGRHTLFGLLPACPNLEVLVASLVVPVRFAPRRTPLHFVPLSADYFPVPRSLLACLAACAPALRRVELLGQIAIRADHAEALVASLPRLEVARFAGLCESALAPAHEGEGEDDTADAFAPPAVHPQAHAGPFHSITDATSITDLPHDALHSLLHTLPTSWPAPAPSPPLPQSHSHPHSHPLHTLDCAEFVPGITAWTLPLPALRLLTARLPRLAGPAQLPALRAKLAAPGHGFAALTHLAHAGPPFNVWTLLARLPRLEWLALDFARAAARGGGAGLAGGGAGAGAGAAGNGDAEEEDEEAGLGAGLALGVPLHGPSAPHVRLAALVLRGAAAALGSPAPGVPSFPVRVLHARRAGMLPALESVALAGEYGGGGYGAGYGGGGYGAGGGGGGGEVWAVREGFRKEGVRVLVGGDMGAGAGAGEYERGATVWANYAGWRGGVGACLG